MIHHLDPDATDMLNRWYDFLFLKCCVTKVTHSKKYQSSLINKQSLFFKVFRIIKMFWAKCDGPLHSFLIGIPINFDSFDFQIFREGVAILSRLLKVNYFD